MSANHIKRLTTSELLGLIEDNQGPEGLDLSYHDLSGLELGADWVIEELNVDPAEASTSRPPWLTQDSSGQFVLNLQGTNLFHANLREINLRFACLRNVNLGGVNAEGANMEGADLQGAFLRRARLTKAYLNRANLAGAYLGAADLEGARLASSNLQYADLTDANLSDADLTKAHLEYANMDSTVFSNTKLSNSSFTSVLIQESVKDYENVLRRHIERAPWLSEKIEEKVQRRLGTARSIYASLKNNFISKGQYEDAVWAYISERNLERDTHSISQARLYYGQRFGIKTSWYNPRLWLFYLKHSSLWLLDWVAEVSSGYGQEPLRTLCLIFLTPFVFAVVYWLLYVLGVGGVLANDILSANFFDYLIYSLGAMVTMQFGHLDVANGLSQIIAVLEAFIGISLAALFMFTLGNRISRL